jgi:bifunctional DNA-binding transcriptional regulator/antitoxin component of YhaV-PrlF toxin-antitoxin module
MVIGRSKLTCDCQISVPAEVCRKLGVGPGSVLEWDEQGGSIVVRRAEGYTWEDIHRALFPAGVSTSGPVDVKEAIRKYIRARYGRRSGQ